MPRLRLGVEVADGQVQKALVYLKRGHRLKQKRNRTSKGAERSVSELLELSTSTVPGLQRKHVVVLRAFAGR